MRAPHLVSLSIVAFTTRANARGCKRAPVRRSHLSCPRRTSGLLGHFPELLPPFTKRDQKEEEAARWREGCKASTEAGAGKNAVMKLVLLALALSVALGNAANTRGSRSLASGDDKHP